MKYLKNILAVLVLFGIFHMSYSAELSVDDITVIDAYTLSVTLSENPNLQEWEIDGEIRVLNDVSLRWALTVEWTSNEVELILQDPLKANTAYSLLTVIWADGSIDFTTPSSVEGFTATNISSVENQDIDTIEIMDDRTIIVRYRDTITTDTVEYKLLAENKVASIEKPDFFSPEIIISTQSELISEKSYILMFIEMQDASGEFLEFDTGIYDFETPIIDNILLTNTQDEDLRQESQNEVENKVQEVLEVRELETRWFEENIEVDFENIPELESAGDELWLVKESEKIGINQAAQLTTQTPDTGAETWVLVIATLAINSFYYLSRRKKAIIAA